MAPRYPLLVDTSLVVTGTQLKDVVLVGVLQTVSVSTPELSVGSGTYATSQDVVVTDATVGAEIHYTLNGADPTVSDPVVSSGTAIHVDQTLTLKVRAYLAGWLPSPVVTARYAIGGVATAEPVVWTNVVKASSTVGTLTKTATTGAWDAGGASTRALSSSDGYVEFVAATPYLVAGLSYGDTDQTHSDVDFGLYVGPSREYGVYEGGAYRGTFGTGAAAGDHFRVSVEGGVVKYSRNGSVFYTSLVAPRYPLLVDTSLVLTGTQLAGVTLAGVLESSTVALPAFTPPAGTYAAPQAVAITSATDATIRYTIDGTDPTATSPVYATPLSIQAPTTVKAYASKPGYLTSGIATATYSLQTDPPVLSPVSATFTQPLSVTMSAGGSEIRYTLDGSDPSAASPLYTGPLTVSATTLVKARAFRSGWSPSVAVDGFYQFTHGTLPTPVIAPATGTYEGSAECTIASQAGSQTYYTLDGSAPTPASIPYTGPFAVNATATVRAASFQTDWTPSAVAESAYEIRVATPAFTPAAGSYSTPQDVAIVSATIGAVVTYTTDGTEPAEAGTALAAGATVHLTANATLKARAWKAGLTPSLVVTASYEVQAGKASVAAGFFHSAAVSASGQLYVWGDNSSGQLGLGTNETVPAPTPIPGFDDVVAAAPGGAHTALLRRDGTVWTAGSNDFGQLGSEGDGRSTFAQVPGVTGVVQIASGEGHVLALKADGTVLAWGWNEYGQLGDGPYAGRSTPAPVSGLTGVTAVAAGDATSLALLADGTVVAFGDNRDRLLGTGPTGAVSPVLPVAGLSNVVRIAAGPAAPTKFAVTASGALYGWGWNQDGELGDGGTTNAPTPVLITGPVNAVSVSGGEEHTVAIAEDGSVWVWGQNYANQLGTGDAEARLSPFRLPNVGSFVAAAAGLAHTLVLTADGRVLTWGDGSAGQLGTGGTDPNTTPTEIAGPALHWQTAGPTFWPLPGTYTSETDVNLACASPDCAIHYTVDGSAPTEASPVFDGSEPIHVAQTTTILARAWSPGRDPSSVTGGAYVLQARVIATPPPGTYAGRIHVGLATEPPDVEVRYTTDGTEPAQSSPLYSSLISVGSTTTLRVKAFHSAYGPSPTATLVYTVAPRQAVPVAGGMYSAVLDPSGEAWAWGSGSSGQLGNGWALDVPEPAPVDAEGMDALAAGASHMLAVRSDGTVLAWGDNSSGQLGLGAAGDRVLAPTPVPGLDHVIALAGGGLHSLALRDDGRVYAWGANGSGQLGDGTTDEHDSPTLVPSLTNIVAIAAGQSHSLALGADGRVWGWGANGAGQIGNESGVDELVPVSVLDGVLSVSAGGDKSLAVRRDGSGWHWGSGARSGMPVALQQEACTYDEGTGTICDRRLLAGLKALAYGMDGTLAIKANGEVWKSRGGEAGEGDLTPILSLAGVEAGAAGSGHALVITSAGEVQAWGLNSAGQVGTGLSGDFVSDPTVIVPAVLAWRLPRPILTPPPGTHSEPITVLLQNVVRGAVVRFTSDGSEPTESSPPAPASIALDAPAQLLARAFKAGKTASASGGGSYEFYFGELDPAAATPPEGTYDSAVQVTLTAVPGASITYWWCMGSAYDYSNCSDVLPYTEPIAVDRTMRIWVEVDKPNWGSSVSMLTYTLQACTPTLSPAGGTVAPGTLITVSCPTQGVSMFYKTNGEWPDPTAQDRPISDGGTIPAGNFSLRVVSLKDGWQPSSVVTGTYTVSGDLTALTLAAGSSSSMAIRSDGTLFRWGSSYGTPSLQARRVDALAAVTRVATGGGHALALSNDGYVWAWGVNMAGQLGLGATTPATDIPTLVPGLRDVVSVAGGDSHSLAADVGGHLWAWGANAYGQLGEDGGGVRYAPLAIEGLGSVSAVAAGSDHSLALLRDGTVLSWGNNGDGQLGDGGTTSRSTPAAVGGLSSIIALAAGREFSLALSADGIVYGWGSNYGGQLGLGPLPYSRTPAPIPGLAGVVAIAASGAHAAAVTGSGEVWEWGRVYPLIRFAPVRVAGLPAVARIAVGENHSLAASADGRVWAWGSGGSYQLGDGYAQAASSPLQIAEAATVWMAARPSGGSGGSYTTEKTITLTSPSQGAVIRYTLDGSEPTANSPTAPSPIRLDRSAVVKARTFAPGWAPSLVSEYGYNLCLLAPSLSPAGGTFQSAVTVVVSDVPAGSEVRFTLDGTDPTADGFPLPTSGALIVEEGVRLRIRAFRDGWTPSPTVGGDFVIPGGRATDSDGDGLPDLMETLLGSDPQSPDTNGDGVPDGAAYAAHLSLTDLDTDHDGLPNTAERSSGTDPFRPDSDDDGWLDGLDCYPLDPARAACPLPDPDDHTPPAIVLVEPAAAVLIGSTP